MAKPEDEALRREIALQLKQHERDLAMGNGAEPPPENIDPREFKPKIPMYPKEGDEGYGIEGPPLARPAPTPRVPATDTGSYTPVSPDAPPGTVDEFGRTADTPFVNPARQVLNMASGGTTEKVVDAVANAGPDAANQVEGKNFESLPPEMQARLAQAAGGDQVGGQAVFVRTPAGWQPGTRTSADGVTSKDPNALRAGFAAQDAADQRTVSAALGTQEADRGQYDSIQQVQQNEMRAVQAFKKEHDDLVARYNNERGQQFDRMLAIQKAMDAVPNAPVTIRQKLDQSGMSFKLATGLAAAFSALGGAMQKDGGRSMQTFLGNMQANIDRVAQREKDEYARLGDRAKMVDNIYATLRKNLGDDVQAMNVTKALYYDAMQNALQQIATQYKLDAQAPQFQSMLAGIAEKRRGLIFETAATMQNQFSQTDRYSPGGLVQVGGGAAKNEYKSTDLEKDAQKFGKELDERGFNMGERAIGLYQKAIAKMKEAGFKNDDEFKRAFVVLADPKTTPARQAAVLLTLDKPQREALQLVTSAGKETLKDSSGKSVTAIELVRDVMEKGGFSIDALDQARRVLAANREQIYKGVARGYHPRVWAVSDARGDLAGAQREHSGIGADARTPVDVKDIAQQPKGQVR